MEGDDYNFISKKVSGKTSVLDASLINPSATKRVEISNGKNSNIDVQVDMNLISALNEGNSDCESSIKLGTSSDEADGPNVLAMRKKQAQKLKQKAMKHIGKKYRDNSNEMSKSRERKEIIKVMPHSLASLSLFMEKKIDNLKRVS